MTDRITLKSYRAAIDEVEKDLARLNAERLKYETCLRVLRECAEDLEARIKRAADG